MITELYHSVNPMVYKVYSEYQVNQKSDIRECIEFIE